MNGSVLLCAFETEAKSDRNHEVDHHHHRDDFDVDQDMDICTARPLRWRSRAGHRPRSPRYNGGINILEDNGDI